MTNREKILWILTNITPEPMTCHLTCARICREIVTAKFVDENKNLKQLNASISSTLTKMLKDKTILSAGSLGCNGGRVYKLPFITPISWDQLEVGMKVELLPINKGLGWQKGILRYNKGYKDENPHSLYNLSPFWYIMAKFPGDYGPVTLMLQDLSNIKIPKR